MNTITEQDFYNMRSQRDQARTKVIEQVFQNEALRAVNAELLEALTELEEYANLLVEIAFLHGGLNPDDYPRLNKFRSSGKYTRDSTLDRARAAIAKAKGE